MWVGGVRSPCRRCRVARGVTGHPEQRVLIEGGDRVELLASDDLHHPIDVLLVLFERLARSELREEGEHLLHGRAEPSPHCALGAHRGRFARSLQLVDDDGETEEADDTEDVEEGDRPG